MQKYEANYYLVLVEHKAIVIDFRVVKMILFFGISDNFAGTCENHSLRHTQSEFCSAIMLFVFRDLSNSVSRLYTFDNHYQVVRSVFVSMITSVAYSSLQCFYFL